MQNIKFRKKIYILKIITTEVISLLLEEFLNIFIMCEYVYDFI